MKYAKKNATPDALLAASKHLHAANESICAALSAVNGVVKVKLLDDYLALSNRVQMEAMRLEDDFAVLVAAKFNVPPRSVPLFGSAENIDQAEQFLNTLTRGGE